MNLTFASYVTLLRILFIFPIGFFMYSDGFFNSILSLLFFILASLTDYFDGYIARKTSTETEIGATLDLIADKLLVLMVLIFLNIKIDDYVLLIFSAIIILREIFLTILRQFNSMKQRLKVRSLGKLKTLIQMISIGMLLVAPHLGETFYSVALGILAAAALLSAISFVDYLKQITEEN